MPLTPHRELLMVLLDRRQWLCVIANDCRGGKCEIVDPAGARAHLPINVKEERKEMDPALIPKEDIDGHVLWRISEEKSF